MKAGHGTALVGAVIGALLLCGATAGCSKKKKKKTTPEAARASTARPESPESPESRGEPRPEARPEPGPEARPEPRTEPRPEARPEPRPEARPEARPRVDPKIKIQQSLAEAKQAFRSGQYTRAIAMAKSVLALDEKNIDAMVIVAQAYFKNGEVELCRAVLQFIADIDPQNAVGFYLAGHLALHDREYRKAKAFFEKAVEKNPNLPDAWSMLCAWYVQGKNWKETRAGRKGKDAHTACTKAVALDGASFQNRLNLGTLYRGLATDCRSRLAARCATIKANCESQKLSTAKCRQQFETCFKPGIASCAQSEGTYYKSARDAYLRANELYMRHLRKTGQTAKPYAPAYFNLGVLFLDALSFPGESGVSRLNKAKGYLQLYLRSMDPRLLRKEQKHVQALIRAADMKIQAEKAKEEARKAAAAAARQAPRPKPR